MNDLPHSFHAEHADDVWDEADAARETTMADRARILESLCRMAAEQIAQHDDPRRALDWQDPLNQESEALLAKLRERYRRHV